MKRHTSIRNFERHTGYCPTYIAWQVLDEARDFLRAPLPEKYAARLARRTETVFAKSPFWQRKFRRRDARQQLLVCHRHWLSALLAREKPALFRRLPDTFKIGVPLPAPRIAA